jgi:hypothetical protein
MVEVISLKTRLDTDSRICTITPTGFVNPKALQGMNAPEWNVLKNGLDGGTGVFYTEQSRAGGGDVIVLPDGSVVLVQKDMGAPRGAKGAFDTCSGMTEKTTREQRTNKLSPISIIERLKTEGFEIVPMVKKGDSVTYFVPIEAGLPECMYYTGVDAAAKFAFQQRSPEVNIHIAEGAASVGKFEKYGWNVIEERTSDDGIIKRYVTEGVSVAPDWTQKSVEFTLAMLYDVPDSADAQVTFVDAEHGGGDDDVFDGVQIARQSLLNRLVSRLYPDGEMEVYLKGEVVNTFQSVAAYVAHNFEIKGLYDKSLAELYNNGDSLGRTPKIAELEDLAKKGEVVVAGNQRITMKAFGHIGDAFAELARC